MFLILFFTGNSVDKLSEHVCDCFYLNMSECWVGGTVLKESCPSLCVSGAILLQCLCLFVNTSRKSSIYFGLFLAFFFEMLIALAVCAGTFECILVCCAVGFL